MPKATAVPVLLLTVGEFGPIVFAPPNVMVWSLVKLVAVLPPASTAVIVRFTVPPDGIEPLDAETLSFAAGADGDVEAVRGGVAVCRAVGGGQRVAGAGLVDREAG